MYRYQPGPAEFGNNPWFCQVHARERYPQH
jgi:hypothetical protein